MNKASTQYLQSRKHKPLEARKNQNELLLEDNALIFSLQNEHLSTCSNFTWLHVDLQPVRVHSIALAVAFSEQMCQVANTVLRALNEHGLHVPDDISLASFDGIDFGEYTIPPLTTMWQDREAIGRGAVQLLLAMIEGTGQEPPPPLIVPTRLVVRKSTKFAPSG